MQPYFVTNEGVDYILIQNSPPFLPLFFQLTNNRRSDFCQPFPDSSPYTTEQPLIITIMTSVWQAKYITRCRAHNHPRSLIQNVASPPPCHCHHQHHNEEHLRTRHEFSSLTILDEFVQHYLKIIVNQTACQ